MESDRIRLNNAAIRPASRLRFGIFRRRIDTAVPHQQAGQRRHFLWGAIASQHTTGKVSDVLRQNRAKVYHLLTSLSFSPEGQVKLKFVITKCQVVFLYSQIVCHFA